MHWSTITQISLSVDESTCAAITYGILKTSASLMAIIFFGKWYWLCKLWNRNTDQFILKSHALYLTQRLRSKYMRFPRCIRC